MTDSEANSFHLSQVDAPTGDRAAFHGNHFRMSKVRELRLDRAEFSDNRVDASKLAEIRVVDGKFTGSRIQASSLVEWRVERSEIEGLEVGSSKCAEISIDDQSAFANCGSSRRSSRRSGSPRAPSGKIQPSPVRLSPNSPSAAPGLSILSSRPCGFAIPRSRDAIGKTSWCGVSTWIGSPVPAADSMASYSRPGVRNWVGRNGPFQRSDSRIAALTKCFLRTAGFPTAPSATSLCPGSIFGDWT